MRNLSWAAAAVLTAFVVSADAAVDPETKCLAAKQKAAAKQVGALLKCASSASQLETSIDPACVAAADAKLAGSFTTADGKAGTPCAGDAASLAFAMNEMTDYLAGVTGTGSCGATKQKAIGKAGAAIFKAYAKGTLKASSGVAAAVVKAEEKLTAAFAKAGICGSASAAEVFGRAHSDIDSAVVCLAADGSCTTTSATVLPGGLVTSDPLNEGASLANPVTTAITSPNGGSIVITEAATELPPPVGYSALGVEVAISAPEATAADPLVITVRIDASLVPPAPSIVRLTRNGEIVEPCTGEEGVAAPDPCETDRELLADGDLAITALSSRASVWTAAQAVVPAPPCSVNGTWVSENNDHFHLEERAAGLVRSLANAASVDSGPFDYLGGDLIRTGPSTMALTNWTNGGSTPGTVDATCQNMYFPAITGEAPAITRTAATYCGDGTVQAGEQCDDGNDDPADGCNPFSADPEIVEIMQPFPPFEMVRLVIEYSVALCVTAPVNCGDGSIDAGEQCDDGNMYVQDGCQPDCTATCGNGMIDDDTTLPDLQEACDDGNIDDGDGCSSSCEVEAP
jgi:cysteine-rich repeat protein